MGDTTTAYYALTKPECGSVNWCGTMNVNLDTIDTLLEGVEDRVADLIQDGTGITWEYNDDAGTFTPTITLTSPLDTDDLTEGSTNLYYTDERVDDRVAALLTAGSGLTETYDDAADTLTLDLGALTENWDAGAYEIRALTFESDVATGTAPYPCASTTVNPNHNSDLLDGQHGSYYSATTHTHDDRYYTESEIDAKKSYNTIGFAVAGALTTGDVAPWSPPMKMAGTITLPTAVVKTVSSSGAVTIDILKSTNNGTSFTTIFSTKITIDQDERSTATAATPSVLSVTTCAVNDIFRINIDGAGTGTADLTVGLAISEAFV